MNRRDIMKLGVFAPMPLFAAGSGRLPSGVTPQNRAEVKHESFGELRTYYSGPTGQLSSMTAGSLRLKPGMSPHPPHTHPEEEFMVVTEGAGEISVDGKTTKVGPGAMMYCAANQLHGIVNTGTEPLTFYYYKWQK